MGNTMATNGAIYVCNACGKTARFRYGFDAAGKNDPEASHGWDSSCMTWSVLCREDSIRRDDQGRVVHAIAIAEQLEPGHEAPAMVLPGGDT